MPPQLALLLCFAFIAWLYRTDRRKISGSWDLLIPGFWFALVSSRSPAAWLHPEMDVDSAQEGSPINLIVYFVIMLLAWIVLARRRFNWAFFFRNNGPLLLLYLYFVVSFLWSDMPFLSLKRIFKDFGTVLVALIMLTEPDPFAAVRLVFVRVSFALFPLSVCFIKYIPSLGRMMSKSWELMYTGVATHKNSLGAFIMVCCLMLVLDVIELRRHNADGRFKMSLRLRYLMLLLGAWLMRVCDSKTSLLCTIIGLLVLWRGKQLVQMRRPGAVLVGYLALLLFLALLQPILGLEDLALEALGRNASLTGRDQVWKMIGQQHINPVVGCGYEVFWDSLAARDYRAEGGTTIVSTHNGYLEVYVDGGAVGVLLLAVMLGTGFRKIVARLSGGDLFIVGRLMFLIAILCHNWSESSYFRLGPVWFTLITTIISLPPVLSEGLLSQASVAPKGAQNAEDVIAITTFTAPV